MLRQFIWGAAVSVCNITIHALVMTVVVHVAQRTSAIAVANRSLLLPGVMIATVSVLMAAHAAEVIVWSAAYLLVGAAPAGSSMVYFAFVNYTTLGYGDITPLKEWQLLGPMTAMNGVLMFGWSTAVIFEVLRRTIASDGPAQVPH
jgi:hypothetical protein